MATVRAPDLAIPQLTAQLSGVVEDPQAVVVEDDGAVRDAWPAGYKLSRTAGPPPPIVVVRPESTEAVGGLVRWAGERGQTVALRGARSNVVGALQGSGPLALSLDRMDRVLALDEVSQIVTVEAGINGGALEDHLNARGFTIGQYPQSLRISTVGGWVSTRATGSHSALYGGIEDAICGLTIVMPPGEVVRIGPRVRPAGGLDLVRLVCGTEGSLGVVTEVSLVVHRILPETTLCAALPSLEAGLRLQRELVQRGHQLGLVRLFNSAESKHICPAEFAGEGDAACLVMVTARGPADVLDRHRDAVAQLAGEFDARMLADDAAQAWFERRYDCATLMADANADAGAMFDTIEVSLPWSTVAACAAELETILGPVSDPYFCHFSHVYRTGVCMYVMLYLRAEDDERVLDVWRAAWSGALETVARHGGAVGHHHGIGAARAAQYVRSPDGLVHRRLKRAIDPDGVLFSRLLEDPSPDA